MQKYSFSVVPSNRDMGGLRMWLVGCPGAGSAICPSITRTGNLDCAPANDSRNPSSPASIGRSGRWSSSCTSASSSSSFGPASVGDAGVSPSGNSVSAPATSPPRYSSSRNSLSADTPSARAMAVRCPSSGNIPPKKAWTALRLKGSACLGSEKDKTGAMGSASQSAS
jgi:hypothetical protein